MEECEGVRLSEIRSTGIMKVVRRHQIFLIPSSTEKQEGQQDSNKVGRERERGGGVDQPKSRDLEGTWKGRVWIVHGIQ